MLLDNLSKKYKLIGIGLIAMGLALTTFALPDEMQVCMMIMRGLQFMGTSALLFGILKKDPEHKDKLLLVWLVLTGILFSALGYSGIECIGGSYYWDFVEIFFAVLLIWAATALLGYLMHYVYQEYLVLRPSTEASPRLVHEENAVIENKSPPPPYIPTTENLSISIVT